MLFFAWVIILHNLVLYTKSYPLIYIFNSFCNRSKNLYWVITGPLWECVKYWTRAWWYNQCPEKRIFSPNDRGYFMGRTNLIKHQSFNFWWVVDHRRFRTLKHVANFHTENQHRRNIFWHNTYCLPFSAPSGSLIIAHGENMVYKPKLSSSS